MCTTKYLSLLRRAPGTGMISVQTFISTMRYWTAAVGGNNLGHNSRSSPNHLQQTPSQQHPSGLGGPPGSASPSNAPGTAYHQGSPKGGATSAGRRPVASPGAGNGNSGAEPNGKAGSGNSSAPAAGPAGSAAAAAERRYADVVASCRLSMEEITGILAEVDVDEHQQEVSYQDHIRTWIPIVFEMRCSSHSQLLTWLRCPQYSCSASGPHQSMSRDTPACLERDSIPLFFTEAQCVGASLFLCTDPAGNLLSSTVLFTTVETHL